MKRSSCVPVAVLLVAGCSLALRAGAQDRSEAAARQAAVAPTPAGNAESGRKLFAADGCYQCHGYEAQGSSATGPRLGPRPMPFAQLLKYVRAPTGQMPPYTAKVVSDADLRDMYAFLQSLPPPPAIDSIPLLR